MAESLIFIVLGVMLVNEQEWFWTEWHPLFSIYSILLCIIVRAAGKGQIMAGHASVPVVFFLTYIINHFTGGVRFISLQEQIIMVGDKSSRPDALTGLRRSSRGRVLLTGLHDLQ